MLADSVDLTETLEDFAEPGCFEPIDLNVEVFRFNTQQLIAYPSADEHCPPAGVAHSLSESDDFNLHLNKNNPLAIGGKGRVNPRLEFELITDDPFDFGKRNPLLQHRVSVSNGDLIVFERLMVDGYA